LHYRTSAATLRKLAEGPMIFELEQSQSESTRASLITAKPQSSRGQLARDGRPGDWDRFQVRNIGLAAQRRMAAKYRGDAERFRREAIRELARTLGVRTDDWRRTEFEVFCDFAVTLSLVDDLREWDQGEKQALLKIIRAKAGSDESRYLRLLQKHTRLRAAIIKLGS
jgi:hypothetical protein